MIWLCHTKTYPARILNFLATTPDSILIKNQLAVKTKFGEAKNVLIRNKENISYSSLFVVDKLHFILYDNMSKRLRTIY